MDFISKLLNQSSIRGDNMKEKPILFSTDMIKAILDGRKAMTRRVIKPQPKGEWAAPGRTMCPYGKIGDRLWVRETFGICDFPGTDTSFGHRKILYKADGETHYDIGKWRSSIFMPRYASRINLEITNIRVERLQSITYKEVEKEGINIVNKLPNPLSLGRMEKEKLEIFIDKIAKNEFSKLWDSINAKRGYGWDINPWVWCISFKII
jgi:hypothetical protein